MDRFAGLPTLRFKCRELGIEATDEELRCALRRIKSAELVRIDDTLVRAIVGGRPMIAGP